MPQRAEGLLADSPRVEVILFEDDGLVPNNPRLPFLVYKDVLSKDCPAMDRVFEELYLKNGWQAPWRWSVYGYHHYHATTHEALGCFDGRATIQFGGEKGRKIEVEKGDFALIPAGVGHKNLKASAGFQMAGTYPLGFTADMKRDRKDDHDGSLRMIAEVAIPDRDPLYGRDGPMRKHWR
ncbi:MAG: cupin domain-containing protein [Verrucomicrobiota bacterium]